MTRIRMLAPVLLCLAACAAPAEAPAAAPPTPTGPSLRMALAQSACPHMVSSASAWVNRMPGTEGVERSLVVSVRFVDPEDTVVLVKADGGQSGSLVLDMRDTASAPIPGSAGYREPIPAAPYASIILRCRGGDVHVISEIDDVR
jgi:hypothetical protein